MRKFVTLLFAVSLPLFGMAQYSGVFTPSGSDFVTRSLSGDFNNVVNVMAHGAIGDGITDDTAAITAALAAASTGGVVLFPSGKTFLTTSQITVPSNGVTLLGYGATVTSDTAAHYAKFLFNGRTGGGVYGLTFLCLGTTQVGTNGCIEIIGSSSIQVHDCVLKDVSNVGVRLLGAATGCDISHNEFNHCFVGIMQDDDGTYTPTNDRFSFNYIHNGLAARTVAYSGGIKLHTNLGTAQGRAGHSLVGNVIDTAGQIGIEIQGYVNECSVSGGSIVGVAYGVTLSNVNRCTVTGVTISDILDAGLEDSAAGATTGQQNSFVGNVVDVRSAAGTLSAASPFSASSTVGFTGSGGRVVGNTFTGSSNNQVYAQGVNNYSFQSNTIIIPTGATSGIGFDLKDYTHVLFADNQIQAVAGNYFMILDSTDESCSDINISGNLFSGTVSSNGVLVYTPNANTQTNIFCHGNKTKGASSTGGFYSLDSTKVTTQVLDNDGGGTDFTDFKRAILALNTNFTFDGRFDFLSMDASGGGITATLETAVGNNGLVRTVAKSDASGNAVTVETVSSQNIIGNNASGSYGSATTYSLAAQGARVTVMSDGANWQIIQAR